ncbi:MAG: hypothetical protein LBH71_04515 [Oscillospiraceae bacterium]|jgi:hypothetical protein|nr:hypothetical protein [Oscillospiraceae bacterium]
MLGKLLKHEISATARMFIPMYVVLIITSVVGKFFIWLTSKEAFIDSVPESFAMLVSALSSILTILYSILIVAVLVATFIFIVMRFYKNLFTDEGYLMFTLPVKTPSLIVSKLISAVLWILFSLVIVIISLVVIFYSGEIANMLKEFWSSLTDYVARENFNFKDTYHVSMPTFAVELIILMLIALCANLLMIYSAIAMGSKFSSKSRVSGAVKAYLVIYITTQIATSILMYILFTVVPDFFGALSENQGDAIQSTIISTGSINIVFCGIYFYITNFFMKKRLNLD